MSDPLSAFDALAGRLADIERRFAGLKDDLDELSGTATDDSGLVTATVDATGELTDLSLAPTALRAGTEDLAAMVLQAYRQARASATEQLNERTEGLDATLGAGLNGIFGTPGDFASLGRLDEAMGRLGRLDGRLPGPPA
ncbi:YbaB/EbfC family nucleoid-associated protein [Micromonospora peucetia]|uniref:Conserved DNA-binding protein YbaB n=1 Tax=Micromonospora peucetia TaxID=47871 RepID=A0A1C6W3L1_9ACTN|nr:YbaB/EbfC family nucleoid-associated protein [Micromonospora peucetia]MCX4390451.1 YbaB/EbfC family nucleoid-associated protein [Micromonospora peucetia]WSA32253.1 YbaB/EbfC family nucleoid-associated protein [Micromonospora peucetia]SCL73111.1 Conserved DNA-binding protein YbaB [Micromonospora peucetia]